MSSETTKHILKVGTDLIYKNGYHSVGLQKILDSAGIPKGSFYYYFKSKEGFGLKIINNYGKDTLEFLKSFLEDTEKSPKDRILSLFESMKTIYEDQNFSQGCLLGNCSIELGAQKESFAKAISSQFDRWQNLFEKTIEEGQKSGNIRSDHSPKEFTSFLLNSWEGALVRMKSIKNNEPMDVFICFMKQLL